MFLTYTNILFNIFVLVATFRVDPPVHRHNGFYKAAVYEHPVELPAKIAETYDEAVGQMLLNLNEYKKQADIAGSQGVDIIVFPEVGIYGFQFDNSSEIENYLEYIPNPAEISWTPCREPDRFNRTKVQTFLSCLAMNNSLFLVANYGDMQPCPLVDPNCPNSGHYQYNTNIIFNRKGELIARYHKQNLFFETQFQQPINPEKIFFDTDFGRFGTFTCFDILFHDPAIPLVEKFNITDVVFPTAWMDALPFFSAIGFHSSFAVAYNVNFLAANLHLPSQRFQGSGIYTPDGAEAYYYDRNAQDGKLLIHDVPIISRTEKKLQNVVFAFGPTELQYLKNHEFKATVFKDWYNCVRLGSRKDKITLCQEGFCCFLSYERDQIVGNYAFGVFNGIHPRNGPYYLQVCILLKCKSEDNESCGRLTFTADGNFKYFNIRGNFSTPYVTPQVIRSDNGRLELLPLHSMTYDKTGLTGSARSTPLLETSLIGRVYVSD
ncbi:pantetheinase-like [Mercenaria mercenaria]|uniref:pantetheinase-like n=1 Tax=Mercenaria mercenaria TaxID=6596 RepID=UPI00234E9D5B|nr:pantetheinase-like [Mercenaria mercenaria]